VHALLIGTGGTNGWPEDGCRCASCMRAAASGLDRRPGRVLVDGTLEFAPFRQIITGTGQPGGPAHNVVQLPGGFDITGPDGGRLLLAAGPGEIPEPAADALPYDIALLDLLASPAQLGRLRAAGLIRGHTSVAALYADHRISSEAELARRCELWRAVACQDGQLVTSSAPGVPEVIPAPGTAAAGPHRTLILGGARSGKSTEAELRLAAEPSVTYLAAGPRAAAADSRAAAPATAAALTTADLTTGELTGGLTTGDLTTGDLTTGDLTTGGLTTGELSTGGLTPGERDLAASDADPGLTLRPASGQLDSSSAGGWAGPDGEPDTEWAERVSRHRARRPSWWRTVESLDIAASLRQETGAVLIDGIGTWLAAVMEEVGMWAGDPPGAGASAKLLEARIDDLIDAWRQTTAIVVAVTDEVGFGLVPPYPAGRVFRDQLGWLNQRLAAESEVNLLVVAGRVTTLSG
jgi:adenosylcobinamide kinase / adenosylcobinamide-phosphate guanylyltransferase